ncbi:MAG: DUF1513 domain-containing protein [Rubrivivax sp.]|nr:DUF1513 domain-containing protein [Rubrivivax sp.]
MQDLHISRRSLLASTLALSVPQAFAVAAPADDRTDAAVAVQRVATAWRLTGSTAGSADSPSGDHVGIVEIDWHAGTLRLQSPTPVPTRGHGLLALADGGFAAVATRPGRWLLRCDAQGQVVARHDIAQDKTGRSFDGHVDTSADGRWLYTVETDPAGGQGWISVRDVRTLARVAQFASGGIDPHQMLPTADGQLMVANGGIPRDASGRKVRLDEMAPCLVRLSPASGRIEGRWTLPDARLSLRHMAWSSDAQPLLGIGLQAEHDSATQRAEAPTLAVFDGESLSLPCADAAAGGYAGDIAAGPGGGFVVSAQKQRLGLWWHPGQAQTYTRVAELTEPCALVSWPGGAGVTLHAARGAARWHLRHAARMLAWPVALAPDNHAVALRLPA